MRHTPTYSTNGAPDEGTTVYARRATDRIWRLFVAMAALPASDERPGAAPVWMHASPGARLLVSCGLGTRGPPMLAAP